MNKSFPFKIACVTCSNAHIDTLSHIKSSVKLLIYLQYIYTYRFYTDYVGNISLVYTQDKQDHVNFFFFIQKHAKSISIYYFTYICMNKQMLVFQQYSSFCVQTYSLPSIIHSKVNHLLSKYTYLV